MTMRSRVDVQPRRVFLVVLAATFLVELAWVLALPAFRGIDEFDHVYKAEAVAHGMLTHEGAAANGRGQLVEVPGSVVRAAAARCRSYEYTRLDNCRAVQDMGDDLVLVASAAATYNPAYYAVVGTVARPFNGAAADFTMRVATAVLAALLMAGAAAVTSTWARSRWPLLALVVAVTPMVTYSSAIASPNGVGYAAGCLLWAGLLGLRANPRPMYIGAAAVAASVVVVSHSTGFVWLTLSLTMFLTLAPTAQWRRVAATFRRQLAWGSVFAAAVLFGTLAWITVNRTNAPGPVSPGGQSMPWQDVPAQLTLWAAQSIGAFPMRNDPAPLPVYGLWLVPFVALMVMGTAQATRRVRVALFIGLSAWIVIPVAATAATYASLELAWQGRYALVLAVGFPALAGFALDQRGVPCKRWLIALVTAVCAGAHALSIGVLAAREVHRPLAPDFTAAVPGGAWLLAILALAGYLVLLTAERRANPSVVLDLPAQEAMAG